MIKRYIIIAGCACFFIFIIIFARLYPVAVVNGSPVWYRTWDRYAMGIVHALIVQTRLTGTEFHPDGGMVSAIKKNSLNQLIEDIILAKAGSTLFHDFNGISNQRIHDAIASSPDLENAALLMYGFTTEDFRNFILLPQSRREVIGNEFDKKKINVEAWLAGIKKKAHVRLILTPYTWDGDTIK